MYLLITDSQYEILQAINLEQETYYRQIQPIKSSTGLWIVNDDLLTDCENVDNTWYSWKTWLLSLEVSPDQIPQPPEILTPPEIPTPDNVEN